MHHGGPFSIPAINNFIPEKAKPWIYILFVIIFQFSGGLYLAAANEMVGATALMQEDILMAGYASLVGMSLVFAIMLRLKMRFTSKFSLIICATVLIICNIICLYTHSVVVLVITCFIAGFFRMWATFECNSTIQLWLTPKRDMSIFFCYVYLLVQGCILLSGITNMYMMLFAKWEYMHWFVIGSLLFLILIVCLIFNNKRFTPPFPLFGIDWLGAFLWGLILLDINFILLYGSHYDWLYSIEIKIAFALLIIFVPLQLYRASFIRHPFVPLAVFKYKAVYMSLIIYLIIDVFLAPAHLLEHIYLGHIMGYDETHLITVNWIGFLGAVTGAIFTYLFFAKLKNSYKRTFLIGFSGIVIYLLLMYFYIDYGTNKNTLLIPIFFRNFGYVTIAIVLITNLMKIPFHHFFQSVTTQAFISISIGSAWGVCVLNEFFKHTLAKNFMLMSSSIDSLNNKAFNISSHALSEILSEQVLMVSLKEIYGDLVIASLAFFILFALYRYPYLPNGLYPRMNTIVKTVKAQLPSKIRAKF